MGNNFIFVVAITTITFTAMCVFYKESTGVFVLLIVFLIVYIPVLVYRYIVSYLSEKYDFIYKKYFKEKSVIKRTPIESKRPIKIDEANMAFIEDMIRQADRVENQQYMKMKKEAYEAYLRVTELYPTNPQPYKTGNNNREDLERILMELQMEKNEQDKALIDCLIRKAENELRGDKQK